MKKYAVIVAAGSGLRMGTSIPKQFLLLHGKPIVWYTIETFLQAFDDIEIILVMADDYMDTGKKIIQTTKSPDHIRLIAGGETRFHSVKNGIQHIHHPSIVFVHDAVRCLVSQALIHNCYHAAMEKGNAIPAIKSTDSIRIEKENGNEVVDRNKVMIIQTPQTFQSDIIKSAFAQDYSETFTDEASVVEQQGIKINLVEGEKTNIKITQPIDLIIAEHLLKSNA